MPGPVNSNVNQMGLLAKPWDVDNLRQDAWHYATRVQAYSLGMLGFLAAARDGYSTSNEWSPERRTSPPWLARDVRPTTAVVSPTVPATAPSAQCRSSTSSVRLNCSSVLLREEAHNPISPPSSRSSMSVGFLHGITCRDHAVPTPSSSFDYSRVKREPSPATRSSL